MAQPLNFKQNIVTPSYGTFAEVLLWVGCEVGPGALGLKKEVVKALYLCNSWEFYCVLQCFPNVFWGREKG